MQRRVLKILLCGFFVLGLNWSAEADQTDELSTLIRPVSNTQQMPTKNDVMRTREAPTSTPPRAAPLAPQPLKDLFLKSKPPKSKDRALETISVEPWMPGRGSLGVQLQVTW
jgi:hypothetical protein